MKTNHNTHKPSRLSRAAAFIAATLLISHIASCASSKKEPEKKSPPAASAKRRQPAKIERAPLAADTYSVLSPIALGNLSQSPELTALRKRGILKAAVNCHRKNLCVKMKYGAQAGFEVELIRKIANDALGVKLNIVEQNDPGADIRLNTTCGAPGSVPQPSKLLAGPYYYSPDSGWLCIEIINGGQPLASALDRTVAHFYNAGAFQQMYKNWFIPDAPDLERNR